MNTSLLAWALLSLCGYVTLADEYYGVLLGELTEQDHGVKGEVYVVDQHRLFIKEFSYDGAGPDAFFYVGKSGTPSVTGSKIPNEMGSEGVLKKYEKKNIVLNLPSNIPASSLIWISVYCRNFRVDFGSLTLNAAPTDIPERVTLPKLMELAHGVSSGPITLLDRRRMLITNLKYDGLGPDAFFWGGMTETPNTDGFIVPNEHGSKDKLKAYKGVDVIITLPEEYSWGGDSVRSLGLWCRLATQNFGHVVTSGEHNLIPYTQGNTDSVLANCEMMNDHLNVAWEVMDDHLVVELMGAIAAEGGYMSFGVSGQATSIQMVGGDVAVASFDNGMGQLEDYYLQSKAFCSGTAGACPDTKWGDNNQLQLINSWQMNGVSTVRYKRPLITGESTRDKNIVVNEDRTMIWALGVLNSAGLVTRHTERGGKQLRLDRDGKRNCNAVTRLVEEEVEAWEVEVLRADENPIIQAVIGPTGGKKGYTAITGEQSWGIAWYLNGLLIPTLVIERGETVTFKVMGGTNKENTAKYHPFYITDDERGGYVAKNQEEKDAVKILAGAVDGQYCEYKVTEQSNDPETYDTFAAYFSTLEMDCEEGAEPGTLTWTPDANTPSVVYYQCYTHQYLGWKIVVVDDYEDYFNAASPLTASRALLILLTALTLALLRG